MTSKIEGLATTGDDGSDTVPALVTDGECLTTTMMRLEAGHSSRPLPQSAVEGIRAQALLLIGDVVRVYNQRVATGEVGFGGSARAAEGQVTGAHCPTGLLYGRIQSGKTNAMILSSAIAIDNGFRTVVVLTSDNVALVNQTADRFRVLDAGPLVYSSASGQWNHDQANIARHLGQHGVVLICSKNAAHLASLIALLRMTGAAEHPALVFDDEADQATPDTTTAARSAGRSSAPAHGSKTFRLTVQNDAASEASESIRETLRHNVFVQVTATPYALLLQNVTSPLRPSFTRLLEPGDGYRGGEHFFSPPQVDDELPPLAFVDPNETAPVSEADRRAPLGLARAIAYFLLSASALEASRGRAEAEGYKFLCHTSPRQDDHKKFAGIIRNHVDELFDAGGKLVSDQRDNFQWAQARLSDRIAGFAPLDVLLERLSRRIHQRRVFVVNAAADPADFGSAYNFIIGGNILGRGLTIDNLLVTYYLRMPRATQMDTMLQHARMFGYRASIMPHTGVFLPKVLAARFARITDAEAKLRGLLDDGDSATPVPVQVVGSLRATRGNVLDANAIGTVRSGQQMYPSVPASTAEQIGNSRERLEAIVERVMGVPWGSRRGEFIGCSLETIIEMVETVRSGDPDSGDWDADLMGNVLRSIASDYEDQGAVLVRDFRTLRQVLVQGAIGGEEQRAAWAQDKPVLFLLREVGDHQPWAGIPFWYPTLVFPKTMRNQVYNAT